jgi:thiamine biosynthesis lipoprotein
MNRVKFPLFIFVFIFLFSSLILANSGQTHKEVLKLMGSRFEITAVSADSILAWNSINAAIEEIRRIEKLISSWDPNSQTSKINRNAGIKPVIVDSELFELIKRSKKVSELTGGMFDISFASIDKVWKFDDSMTQIPTEEEIAASVSKISYENIILNEENSTVFLKNEGMKIGFGGIGKGYAANRAKAVMATMGVSHGVVNASGDLITWGKQENGQDWSIAIADPKDKIKIFGWLNISDQAVVTSGNYENFVEFNGKRYGHIINPKTGMPATGTKSVTIICPDVELADALATAVFILGENEGVELINQLNGIECLFINDEDEIITSKNLKLNFDKNVNTIHNIK